MNLEMMNIESERRKDALIVYIFILFSLLWAFLSFTSIFFLFFLFLVPSIHHFAVYVCNSTSLSMDLNVSWNTVWWTFRPHFHSTTLFLSLSLSFSLSWSHLHWIIPQLVYSLLAIGYRDRMRGLRVSVGNIWSIRRRRRRRTFGLFPFPLIACVYHNVSGRVESCV